jgi:hypothetical protein
MSGPITASYFLVSATLAAVAEAMRQAHAMKQDYADVLAQLQQREGRACAGPVSAGRATCPAGRRLADRLEALWRFMDGRPGWRNRLAAQPGGSFR